MLERPPNIENVGPLGIRTRFGWFLPKSSSDRLPAHQIPIEALAIDRFANISDLFHVDIDRTLLGICPNATELERFTPEHCAGNVGRPCAVMLAGHRSSSAFIVEHIRRLRVSVQVVWLGDQFVRVKNQLLVAEAKLLFLFLARTPSEAAVSAAGYRHVTVQWSNAGPLSEMQASVYDLTPMTKYRNLRRNHLGDYIDAVHLNESHQVRLSGKLAAELSMVPTNASAAMVASIYDRVACDWLSTGAPDEFRELMQRAVDSWNGINEETVRIGGIFPIGPMYDVLKQAVLRAIAVVNRSGWLRKRPLVLDEKNPYDPPLRQFLQLGSSQMLGVIGPDLKEIACRLRLEDL